MEARRQKRYEVDGEAEVIVGTSGTGSSLLRGRILDLSSAGCYIQTLAPITLQRDTPVYIEFWLYRQHFRIRAASKFAHTKVGIGFTFTYMDDVTKQRLEMVLEKIKSSVVEYSADGTRGFSRKKAV